MPDQLGKYIYWIYGAIHQEDSYKYLTSFDTHAEAMIYAKEQDKNYAGIRIHQRLRALLNQPIGNGPIDSTPTIQENDFGLVIVPISLLPIVLSSGVNKPEVVQP